MNADSMRTASGEPCGTPFQELIDKLIHLALERRNEASGTFTSHSTNHARLTPGRLLLRHLDSARILWLLQTAGIAPKQRHISFSCSQGRRLANDTSRSTCR